MPLHSGEVFAGYVIQRLLGTGGMGEVYLAQHPRLPRQDALKILSLASTADREFRARFIREAELAATLRHPHIVGVLDRGEYDGRLWISMDFVVGTDAGRLIPFRSRYKLNSERVSLQRATRSRSVVSGTATPSTPIKSSPTQPTLLRSENHRPRQTAAGHGPVHRGSHRRPATARGSAASTGSCRGRGDRERWWPWG